jgi:cytochrome c5
LQQTVISQAEKLFDETIFHPNVTTMKKTMLLIFGAVMLYACGQKTEQSGESTAAEQKPKTEEYDPQRGEGKFDKVEISDNLDAAMAASGKQVFDMKCSACHKLTDEKLVGPGWKGVSTKHKPEWLMNFITNPDAMIDKDPQLQAQLELCLVRMPNQNLTDDDARHILEFMRQNDGVK